MDSEHRHELKTNELADWIARFPEWCRSNARTLIGVGLVATAAVVFLWGRHIRGEADYRRQAEAVLLIEQYAFSKLRAISGNAQDVEAKDAIMIAADQLEMAVDDSSPHVAALLLIKRGDALRSDLHYRPGEVDEKTIEKQTEDASKAYERALTLAKDNPTLTAMARLGLGLCAEETGDYIKAEEIYNAIISNQDFRATLFPAEARHRLDNMDENRRQYVFADAPAILTPDSWTPSTISPADGEVSVGDGETPAVVVEDPLQENLPLPSEGEPVRIEEPRTETPAEQMGEVEEVRSEEGDESDASDMNS